MYRNTCIITLKTFSRGNSARSIFDHVWWVLRRWSKKTSEMYYSPLMVPNETICHPKTFSPLLRLIQKESEKLITEEEEKTG